MAWNNNTRYVTTKKARVNNAPAKKHGHTFILICKSIRNQILTYCLLQNILTYLLIAKHTYCLNSERNECASVSTKYYLYSIRIKYCKVLERLMPVSTACGVVRANHNKFFRLSLTRTRHKNLLIRTTTSQAVIGHQPPNFVQITLMKNKVFKLRLILK